jgi:ribonuclease HI
MEIHIWCDGLCEPNPGGWMAWAFVARAPATGAVIASDEGAVAPRADATNNVAEYGALIRALGWARDHTPLGTPVVIHSDSQLVVNQLNGLWDCRQPVLLRERARTLAAGRGVTYQWVPREENTAADDLTRVAYRAATGHAPPERVPRRARTTRV